MTFSVILKRENEQKIIGTIWAPEQQQATSVAADLCGCQQGEAITVQPCEDDREVRVALSN